MDIPKWISFRISFKILKNDIQGCSRMSLMDINEDILNGYILRYDRITKRDDKMDILKGYPDRITKDI